MKQAAATRAKLAAISAFERLALPDAITRLAIEGLVRRTRVSLAADGAASTRNFARAMTEQPIATHTEAANAQHYEVPAAFFARVLGPHRKYSSCLYAGGATSLAEAELAALEATARHAQLDQGQNILELGCGWGSLSLFMADRFPASKILAVSNSKSQRIFIENEAHRRGLHNLQIVTADVNAFRPEGKFDRVVSVEMFEHVANWPALLARIRSWLSPGGLLFMHVFSHARVPYRFDHTDPADWIARHFFTGGLMPSHGLIREFEMFELVQDWRWNGENYARTANDWLANFDRDEAAIAQLFAGVYGDDARLWMRRWRLFFLATAGLFGHRGGEEWGVSHYLLRPDPNRSTAPAMPPRNR
jgi:cyclopropane-fatty-acyl-phospholipid synthase